jgi:hypothetical protein
MKRPSADSPSGELQPPSIKVKIDGTTAPMEDSPVLSVFSQLDMLVPEDAVADDNWIDAAALECKADSLVLSIVDYFTHRYSHDEKICEVAVHTLAAVLLPFIFRDHKDGQSVNYTDIINRNPWLVRMLFTAHESGQYKDIRRLRS